MASVRVPNFRPSGSGFRFANIWPHEPIREFRLGDIATLTVGDAVHGLCGGMSFTVADLHLAGLPRPADAAAPVQDAKYQYIVDRQLDSMSGVWLPLRFYDLMSPSRPDREPIWVDWLGRLGIDRHSRSYVMIHDAWPTIRMDLDAGRPAMIGLVRVVSTDPSQLNRNHQVLVYGYDLEGTALTLRIYDPNWPDDDNVTLSLNVADPRAAVSPTYSKADGPLYCFFNAPYSERDPTPWR
jgi:hypothetical protein